MSTKISDTILSAPTRLGIPYVDRYGRQVLLDPNRFGEGFYQGPTGMVCPRTYRTLHYVRVKRPGQSQIANRLAQMFFSKDLEQVDQIAYGTLIVYDRHVLGQGFPRVIVLVNCFGRFVPCYCMEEYNTRYPNPSAESRREDVLAL